MANVYILRNIHREVLRTTTMTDYYEPTLLFRQNAIRRFQTDLSPIQSVESFTSYKSSLLRNDPRDTQVLDKSCLDKLNIKSNYWKIPETEFHMTAMSVSNDQSVNPTLALASGARDSNLFIYELDMLDSYLVHHKTITLPNIYGMSWLDKTRLITGNNKGYAHLIQIPAKDDELPAEICTRFNHKKHLRNKSEEEKSGHISKLGFAGSNLISIYSENLFSWNVGQSKATPTSISKISGLLNFDVQSESTLGICGKFGVSMFDLRSDDTTTLQYSRTANNIKFNPDDSQQFATSYYDGIVKIFDVRNTDECLIQLQGHKNKVNTVEWNKGDLFTGGNDGNIIHWDLTEDYAHRTSVPGGMVCTLKDGLDSVHFNPVSNSLVALQRQCGTILPASNTNIIAMCSVKLEDDLKLLSVDGSSFFGLHTKSYNEYKTHYTEEDIRMMIGASSNSTLVESANSSQVSLVKPLEVKKHAEEKRKRELWTQEQRYLEDPTLVESDEEVVELVQPEKSFAVPKGVEDKYPKYPKSPTFVDALTSPTSDFNFKTWEHSNGSGFSVQSDSIDLSSPETINDLFNESVDTLSTGQSSDHDVKENIFVAKNANANWKGQFRMSSFGSDWYSKALSFKTENVV